MDQVLPHSCTPEIYESAVQDARAYVQLAVAASGALPAPRPAAYPWGIALQDLRVGWFACLGPALRRWEPPAAAGADTRRRACPPACPHLRRTLHRPPPVPLACLPALATPPQDKQPDAFVINLETAVTTWPRPWPAKGINYRMHPGGGGAAAAAARRAGGPLLRRGSRRPPMRACRCRPPALQATWARSPQRGWACAAWPTTTQPTGAGKGWRKLWRRCRAQVGHWRPAAAGPLASGGRSLAGAATVWDAAGLHAPPQPPSWPHPPCARAGLQTAGAGRDLAEAEAPAVVRLPPPGGRLLVWAVGHESSGVPLAWAAARGRPGVALADLTPGGVEQLAAAVRRHKQPGDLALVSVHWGSNWGFGVPPEQRAWAHALIDEGAPPPPPLYGLGPCWWAGAGWAGRRAAPLRRAATLT